MSSKERSYFEENRNNVYYKTLIYPNSRITIKLATIKKRNGRFHWFTSQSSLIPIPGWEKGKQGHSDSIIEAKQQILSLWKEF